MNAADQPSCTLAPEGATLTTAAAALAQERESSRGLTEAALARIQAESGEGARCFIASNPKRARRMADASDRIRASGMPRRSAIDGLPISVKDLFDVADEPTRAGSIALSDAAPATADAEAVARLLAAGAVMVGRTNMTEFAYSGVGLNPHFGTPANPWDRARRRVPGGSSSGAAVAVADGMCIASVGSDTGGSVRIPAALCGLVGFKPTARRIPMRGMLPLSTTLDSVGVIAADVAGCAALDTVLAGGPAHALGEALSGKRLLVPSTLVLDDLDPHVARAFEHALRRLSAAGAKIVEQAVPEFSELAGINNQGGFAAVESWRRHADIIQRRSQDIDPRVLTRIRKGSLVDSAAHLALFQARSDWTHRVSHALAGFDVLAMPTVPVIAPPMREVEENDAQFTELNLRLLRNPSIVNFLDGCAVSLPCHEPGEAPVGLSLVGQTLGDAALLGLAAAAEPLIVTRRG